MRLKFAVTAVFIFGLLLLAMWPWIVGNPPLKTSPKHDQIAFVIRFIVYVAVLLITFFTTTVLAWLYARKTREQFREAAHENLRGLIEGTLQDHERKK